MGYGYKRFPTPDEAVKAANGKYGKGSLYGTVFMEGFNWAMKEANRVRTTERQSVLGQLKFMKVGDILKFNLYKWDCVRTAASKLKNEFGVQYFVRKVYSDDDVYIAVIRQK